MVNNGEMKMFVVQATIRPPIVYMLHVQLCIYFTRPICGMHYENLKATELGFFKEFPRPKIDFRHITFENVCAKKPFKVFYLSRYSLVFPFLKRKTKLKRNTFDVGCNASNDHPTLCEISAA